MQLLSLNGINRFGSARREIVIVVTPPLTALTFQDGTALTFQDGAAVTTEG